MIKWIVRYKLDDTAPTYWVWIMAESRNEALCKIEQYHQKGRLPYVSEHHGGTVNDQRNYPVQGTETRRRMVRPLQKAVHRTKRAVPGNKHQQHKRHGNLQMLH